MKARIEFNVTLWLLALVGKGLLAFAPPPLAFGTRKCGGRGGLYMTTTPADGGRDASSTFCRQHCILYSTPSKDDDDDDVSESETTVLTKEKLMSEARVTPPAVPTTEPKEKEDNTQQQLPPIDLPSPLLLGTSMVLAIAGTGSLFELTNGSPPSLGVPLTAAIAVLGIPSCLFFFYAAILKGQAETEQDDKAFLGK